MSGKQGFTFTISMLLLCLTLISMAAYAPEWRKSQLDSLSSLMPSDGLRLQERISAGVSEILSADAAVLKNSTGGASIALSGRFPFKREGEPISRMDDYANSLPHSLRGTGLEAVLTANSLRGSNATVMNISGTGSLVYSNDGHLDSATYYHPEGSAPALISISLHCEKTGGLPGQFSFQQGSAAGPGYSLRYADSSGYQELFQNSTLNEGNASAQISFPDGTRIELQSEVSGTAGRNYTRLSIAKSPGSFLILPFEQNATVGEKQVLDYSPLKNNLTLGGGNSNYAPEYLEEGCALGSCYSFDGLNDYINRTDFPFTESELEFPLGTERILNGDYENHTGSPDDGSTDTWTNWTKNGTVVIDSTNISVAGHAINFSAGNTGNFTWQEIRILQNVPYTLSFFARSGGSGSPQYAIYDADADRYLQYDGTWGSEYYFNTGLNVSSYAIVSRQFALPAGSNKVRIHLAASTTSNVFFDNVSLRQSAGLNGGFEYYFPDTTN